MKQIGIFSAIILIFFVLLTIFVKAIGPLPLYVNSVSTTKTDTFDVTGEGKVDTPPDIATLSVGVQSSGATVQAAQDQLNTNINQVSSSIKNLGVDSKDIKTENYNISPNYNFLGGSQKIQGYNASSNLTITVRDLNKVNQVIDSATQNGANIVGGVSFDVSNKTKAEDQARQLAVAEAKQKAQDAARIAGFSLGRLVNYSEDFGNRPVPIPMIESAAGAQATSPSTKVEPGSNEIDVTVTLSYEIQ